MNTDDVKMAELDKSVQEAIDKDELLKNTEPLVSDADDKAALDKVKTAFKGLPGRCGPRAWSNPEQTATNRRAS